MSKSPSRALECGLVRRVSVETGTLSSVGFAAGASARWARRKLNAAPPAVRIIVIAATVLAAFSATNFAYQVMRKPTEMFFLVSGALNKEPAETWRQYPRSSATIPPPPSHPSCWLRWPRSRAPAIQWRAPIGVGA